MHAVEEFKEMLIDGRQLASEAISGLARAAGNVVHSGGRRTTFAMARGNLHYMKHEVPDEEPDFVRKLTPFQQIKIAAFFDIMLDADGDGFLTKHDVEWMARRLNEIAGREHDSEEATATKDSLRGILEAFMDTTKHNINDGKISKKEFLNYFGKHCQDVASVNQFPYQVQLIPRILFTAIGRGKKQLTPADLNKFYRAYLPKDDSTRHSPQELDDYTQRAYNAFTGNGEIPLTSHVYGLVFSNFLLGRSQQTPGKYILPCFDVDGQIDAKRYAINWNASD